MSSSNDNGWLRVAGLDEIAVDEMMRVTIGEHEIALYRLGEDEVRATDNICTHALAYLTDGWLEDGEIECPLHGGRFDVRTGQGLCAPIEKGLRLYPVRLEGQDILLRLGGCGEDAR